MLTTLRLLKPPHWAALDMDRLSRWVRMLTNKQRARQGLVPLQPLPQLDDVARFHTANMSKHGFFDHVDPHGRSPQDRLAVLHPEVIARVGENIAMVPAEPEEQLASSLVASWMDSPGHRQNILEPSWTHLGVGVQQSGRYVFATQLFAEAVAEMLGEKPPLRSVLGRTCSFRFLFLGRFPREDLLVVLRVPDARCRFALGNGLFAVGWRPLEISWTGDVFAVCFRPEQKPGVYELHLASSRAPWCAPCVVRVAVR